jgi:hypothetical protein
LRTINKFLFAFYLVSGFLPFDRVGRLATSLPDDETNNTGNDQQ